MRTVFKDAILSDNFEADVAIAKAQYGSGDFGWIEEDESGYRAATVLAYACFEMLTANADPEWLEFLVEALSETIADVEMSE